MNEKHIARRFQKIREPGRTDWQRLRSMSEEDIDRGALSDPDNPRWTKEELASAELVSPSGERKVPVSIRLDPEVVEFFKEAGPGYQSRISTVLLAYVRSRRRRHTG